jgi:hypothetical protein
LSCWNELSKTKLLVLSLEKKENEYYCTEIQLKGNWYWFWNEYKIFVPQALVSFKKYMPPPLPYFKVNICPLPLPHFASIFFANLWSFRWPNYIVTLPRDFSFRLPHLNINTGSP